MDKFSYFLLNQVCCSFGARKAKGLKTVPLAIQMTASQLSARNALSMIENIVEVQNKMDPSGLDHRSARTLFCGYDQCAAGGIGAALQERISDRDQSICISSHWHCILCARSRSKGSSSMQSVLRVARMASVRRRSLKTLLSWQKSLG